MDVSVGVRLTEEEVLSLLKRFDDSSDIPLHEGLEFRSYSKKLSVHAHFVLAYEGTCQVGFIAYYLNEEGKYVYLPQVVVHKDARHRGIGHRMFQTLLAAVFPTYQQLFLEVLKDNSTAFAFYTREGFCQSEDRGERILMKRHMNEVERIICDGVIPKEFFKEETRCDYHVTEYRKKIWAVELDILLKFDAVCRKHGLKYYLIGGTLLGSVRHRGFIPWDDDIDVGMPRKDYDRFLELSEEFTDPYFLQTPYTDCEYAYSYAKIRNSNTTCVPKMFRYQHFNHGIFIDVFPYENWSEESGEYYFNRIKQLGYENSTYMRLTNPHLDKVNMERVANWCGRDHLEVYEEIQRLSRRDENKQTERMAKVVFSGKYEQELYYSEDLQETILGEFEGYYFPIPKGYDRMLSIFYGDYMTLPSIENRNGGHEDAFFSPDVSYKEYLKTIL